MYLYINIEGWRPRELLGLISRNSEETREEILTEVFVRGLRDLGKDMLLRGKFASDRLTRSEILALFSDSEKPGYSGFRVSAISSGIGPGIKTKV